jgi:hypothetical protein
MVKPVKTEEETAVKLKGKENVPLIYLYIYSKMLEKFGHKDIIMSTKNLIEICRRTVHQIPKKYDFFILKELENYDFLKKINTQKYLFKGTGNEKKLSKLNDYFLW